MPKTRQVLPNNLNIWDILSHAEFNFNLHDIIRYGE